MERPLTTIAHAIEEPAALEALGFWAALWVEEVVVAAEFWAVRSVQSGLAAFLWLRRRPLAIVAAFVLAAGSALALDVRNILISAREMTARLDVRVIANAAELSERDRGAAPSRLENLVPACLRDLRTDPWGRSYVLVHGPGGLAVVTAGRDGVLGTPDDVVRVLPNHAAQEQDSCSSLCLTDSCDGAAAALDCARGRLSRNNQRRGH